MSNPAAPPVAAEEALDHLFSTTLGDLRELVPEFPRAVARAVAATAVRDGVVTSAEYEALAACAGELEGLSSVAGLMSYLILDELCGKPDLASALRQVRSLSKDAGTETRRAILQSTAPLIEAQHQHAPEVASQWAKALRVEAPPQANGDGPDLFQQTREWMETCRRLLPFQTPPSMDPGERARRFLEAFDDDELRRSLDDWEGSDTPDSRALERSLAAATERALARAFQRLKCTETLAEQRQLAERFQKAIELLGQEVVHRLRTVDARLHLQSEMFAEDLDNFVERSLDGLEIEMRDLVQERDDWTAPEIWERFQRGAAYSEIRSHFEPLRRRYTRLFDQWNTELQLFTREAGAIRSTILANVDTRTFAALVPTEHSTAAVKVALDRAASTTLGVSGLSALVGGGLLLTGTVKVATLAALFTNPLGLAVGGAVGAAVAGAGLWKTFAKPERRKTQLVKTKREAIRSGLKTLLATECLNHDELAQDVLHRFVEAAREQYSPLMIEARVCYLKACKEQEAVARVLRDTRSFLGVPPPPNAAPPLEGKA